MEIDRSRRSFLGWLVAGAGGLIAGGYGWLGLRVLSSVRAPAAALQDVGPLSAFAPGVPRLVTYTGAGEPDGVWVVAGQRLLALDFHCTHLDCPVRLAGDVFACPCHGSTFALDGRVLTGPASRPLRRHEVLIQAGRVLVGGLLS